MTAMPPDEYLEERGQGYFIAGTRISLDSVAHALARGQSVEEILADFPAIGSLKKVEGVVAFVRAHPSEVRDYLDEGTRAWEEARKLNPPDLVKKAPAYRARRDPKSA
jgi:uncharacterized protein (DUF433 family)